MRDKNNKSYDIKNDCQRLAQIGIRAAELCYKNNLSSCRDNICVGKCAAVIPYGFLDAAAIELTKEYWAGKNNSKYCITEYKTAILLYEK